MAPEVFMVIKKSLTKRGRTSNFLARVFESGRQYVLPLISRILLNTLIESFQTGPLTVLSLWKIALTIYTDLMPYYTVAYRIQYSFIYYLLKNVHFSCFISYICSKRYICKVFCK